MFRNMAKRLVLGVLTAALLITSVVIAPTDTQAAGKKAKISDYYSDGLLLDGQKGYFKRYPLDMDKDGAIANKNKNATYTYESSDKNALTITANGKVTAVNTTKAKKKVNIIVRETLNKKTRKVGTIAVEIVTPQVVNKNVKWSAGQTYYMEYEEWFDSKIAKKSLPYVPFWYWSKCTFRGTDKKVTQATINKWLSELNSSKKNDKTDDQGKYYTWKNGGVTVKDKAGKLNCAFFAYDYSTKKYYYVDSFTATIKKVTKAKSVSLDSEYNNFDDYGGKPFCVVGETRYLTLKTNPSDYIGKITATSSNKSVAKVSVKKDEIGNWCLNVKGLKKGNVTITVKTNGAKKTFKLKVITEKQYNEYNGW